MLDSKKESSLLCLSNKNHLDKKNSQLMLEVELLLMLSIYAQTNKRLLSLKMVLSSSIQQLIGLSKFQKDLKLQKALEELHNLISQKMGQFLV